MSNFNRGGQGRGQGGSRGGGGRGRGRGGFGDGFGPRVFQPASGIPPVDQAVTSAENALISPGNLNLGSLRLKDNQFPLRPGFGTAGTAMTLWANYVELKAPNAKLVLHRYDVSVDPEAVGKKRTQIIKLLRAHSDFDGLRDDVVSDFKSTLLSCEQLPKDKQSFDIKYRAEGEDEPKERATSYKVRLQHTNTLALADLVQYLTSTDLAASYDDKLPMIQALNIFLNHHSKSHGNLVTIGSSKTFSLDDKSDKHQLGAGLIAIRGFFASVRAATSRILVNVNVSHGAFYESGPLNGLMKAYDMQLRNKARLASFLMRIKIKTTHLKEKKNKAGEVIIRQKTIAGLATAQDGRKLAHSPIVKQFGAGPKDVQFWLDGPQNTSAPGGSKSKAGKGRKGKGPNVVGPEVPSTSGRYISVFDFFKQTYNKVISMPELPVVNVGTRDNPTYLPAEVCVVLPGQNANSKLDPGQTQNMIKFAVRNPAENESTIVGQGLETVGLRPETNKQLNDFGFSVSPKLITVMGRLLRPPRVLYKGPSPADMNKSPGSWNLTNKQFSLGGSACGKKWSWLIVKVEEGNLGQGKYDVDVGKLDNLLKSFGDVLHQLGIDIGPPMRGRVVTLSNQDDPQMDKIFADAATALSLLFIILPTDNMPLYNRIKKLGDVQYGVATINVVGSKFSKGQDQYFRNVAMKFNLKLGGNNQSIDSSRLGLVMENKTMIVGIDVTHPSPGSSSNAPSIAAMVASVDSDLGQWPATLRVQKEAREEMVTSLKDMLKSRLQLWQSKHNRKLPENILVYRDGVSEGQHKLVLEKELPQLREACKEMYSAPEQKVGLPRFTIIIAGKRHHARFGPTREADADNKGNAKPGTVVDRGVTEARNWDFFLQAHAALQGSARPAHYFVVLDEIFRQYYKDPGKKLPPPYRNVADAVEDLTQSLSYIFGRATRSVSYCTPAYYADIVCERARCYLSNVFDESPTDSVISGQGGGSIREAMEADVKIHPKLANTMFYI